MILIFFGASKLPQVGGALGRGLRAFRKGQSREEGEEQIAEPAEILPEKAALDSKE